MIVDSQGTRRHLFIAVSLTVHSLLALRMRGEENKGYCDEKRKKQQEEGRRKRTKFQQYVFALVIFRSCTRYACDDETGTGTDRQCPQSQQATAARVLEKECKQSEENGRRNTIMLGSPASRLQTLLLRNKRN